MRPHQEDPRIEPLICAVLRDEKPDWPGAGEGEMVGAFLNRSDHHGVQPLLLERLTESNWPPFLLRQLRRRATGQALWEMQHRQMLNQVLATLAANEAGPVLFKGTALAYSLYSSPVLRTRGDTDLIIPPEAMPRADAALLSLGFYREMGVSGQFVSYQTPYSRNASDGEAHTLDLHWRINNSQVLARLFTHGELRQQARLAPQLGPDAWIAAPVHALLLAAMHRATHRQNPYYVSDVAHFGGDRLIWLYDIHLLAGTLDAAQWNELLDMAELKGLLAVCREAFELSSADFGTVYPEGVLARLKPTGIAELPAIYLESGNMGQQWMDICAVPGIRDRCRFLIESLFPSGDYMRHKFPQSRLGWLPWLYARRFFSGVFRRWIRR